MKAILEWYNRRKKLVKRASGRSKTHLQHILTAVAINLVRIDAVLTQMPRGRTRRSHFARLALHPGLQDSVAA
jgi:hypothetical protein